MTILTVNNALTLTQARTELNDAMHKLRTEYGYAPPKNVSYVEMKFRCTELSNAINEALEQYVVSTGKLPERMRNLYGRNLEAYANVPDDRLKKAPLYTVEAAGNLLDFNADYLIKAAHNEAVAKRTRKEWARLEYEYVERNDYNLRDLYDDLMKRLDATENYITVEEYREERRKWKRCKYYACDNYFPIAKDRIIRQHIKARRIDAEYCCDECKKAQENAKVRYEKTGTFLPDYAYEYVLEETREKNEKNHIVVSPEKIFEKSL